MNANKRKWPLIKNKLIEYTHNQCIPIKNAALDKFKLKTKQTSSFRHAFMQEFKGFCSINSLNSRPCILTMSITFFLSFIHTITSSYKNKSHLKSFLLRFQNHNQVPNYLAFICVHLRSFALTCKDALIQRVHGCTGAVSFSFDFYTANPNRPT